MKTRARITWDNYGENPCDENITLSSYDECGVWECYRNGLLDNENGHAREEPDGSKYWFRNGLRHRIDGPAIEHPDGTKVWFQNDLLHNIDGPAIIGYIGFYDKGDFYGVFYKDGVLGYKDESTLELVEKGWYEEYWVNGKRLTEEEFYKRNPNNQ